MDMVHEAGAWQINGVEIRDLPPETFVFDVTFWFKMYVSAGDAKYEYTIGRLP